MNCSKSLSFKKVLTILIGAFLLPVIFLLTSCSKESAQNNKKMEFSLDDKGYPKNNIVMINGKAYPLDFAGESHRDSEIEIKMDGDRDIVEITLPQYLPINYWSLDENEYMNLVSYSRIDFPIKDENMVEGPSAAVQKFVLKRRAENKNCFPFFFDINLPIFSLKR